MFNRLIHIRFVLRDYGSCPPLLLYLYSRRPVSLFPSSSHPHPNSCLSSFRIPITFIPSSSPSSSIFPLILHLVLSPPAVLPLSFRLPLSSVTYFIFFSSSFTSSLILHLAHRPPAVLPPSSAFLRSFFRLPLVFDPPSSRRGCRGGQEASVPRRVSNN